MARIECTVLCSVVSVGAALAGDPNQKMQVPVGGVMTTLIAEELAEKTVSPFGIGDMIVDPMEEACIDFDDLTQPCVFLSQVALRGEYAGVGVEFDGPGPSDGGGILGGCGGFGVQPHSGLNFLAFNRNGEFSDGGTPTVPQTIRFDTATSSVSIWVSGGLNDAEFSMEAFDGSGGSLGSVSVVTPSTTWHKLSIDEADIKSVVVNEIGGAPYFVMDDLCWNAGSCLTMEVDRLVGGSQATWMVTGATGGARVAIVYGHQSGSTIVNGAFGYCASFEIKGVSPSKVICQKNANGAGDVSCTKSVPSGASGVRVLSQAAEHGTCPEECMSEVDVQIVG